MAKKYITKKNIFESSKKSFEPRSVYVPDWDGDILYRPMSMAERRHIRKKVAVPATDELGNPSTEIDQEALEIWSIINCTLDPDDTTRKKLMFGPQDYNTLENDIAAGALTTLSVAILKASGLGQSTFRKVEEETEE